jgi:Fe-S cluster biogenesis protein NfuA
MTAGAPTVVNSDTYNRVLEIVDGDIRPLLKIHGGDVCVLQVAADGHVELEFEGACRGCALQTVTYAVGIRRRLLEVPGVSDVSMNGVKVSPIALERIAKIYEGYTFRMNRT